MRDVEAQVAMAIRRVRSGIHWRPGRDSLHLAKRIRQGHLPPGTTLAEYEAIILNIMSRPEAVVYVYRYASAAYPAVVAPYEGRVWLVMFNMEGIMETAFPPDKPDAYFDDPRYIPLGSAGELVL